MDARPKLSLDLSPTFRGPKGGSIELREGIPTSNLIKLSENSDKSPNLRIAFPSETSSKEANGDLIGTENTDLEESDHEGQIALQMHTLNSSRTSSRGTARCPSYSPCHRSATPKATSFLRLAPSPSPLRLSNRTERTKCPLILDLTARETGEMSMETSRLEMLKQLGATIYPKSRKVQPVKTRTSIEKPENKDENEGNLRKIYEEMENKLRAQVAELTKSLMQSKEDKLDADKTLKVLKTRIETEAADYQSRLKEANTSIDKLAAKHSHMESKATDLENRLHKAELGGAKAEEDCRAAREMVYVKERENAALKANCERLRTELAELQGNERKLQQEIVTLKEKLFLSESKQTSNLRNSKLEQRSRDSETEELTKDKVQMQAFIGKITQENEHLRCQVATLSKKLAFSKGDELEAKENIDSFLLENTQLKAVIARFDHISPIKCPISPLNRPISREDTVQFASPPHSPIDSDFSTLNSAIQLKLNKRNAQISSQSRSKLATLQEERTQVDCI